ncbi:MAG: MarR family transcriptional regulator [Myxococcota bacterium]|nr:MarR family transcriptional regulator [Myxococcota bacterium]
MKQRPDLQPSVRLWSLLVAFERRLAHELSDLGISVSGFRLIGEVSRSPDGVRQAELARRLGVRPPTVSAAVARLEAQGLVRRVPDPDDPRARRVLLADGVALRPGFDVLGRMDELLCGGMPESERQQTLAILDTLTQRLEHTK